MDRRLKKAMWTWLSAERGGGENAAESALRGLFARLPLPAPPAALTNRVLAALGFSVPARAGDLRRWQWKAVVGSGLLLAAVAAPLLPVALGLVWQEMSAQRVIEWMAGGVVSACLSWARGVTVWQTVSGVGDLISGAISSPLALAAMAAALFVSFGAFKALRGLITVSDRSHRHVRFR